MSRTKFFLHGIVTGYAAIGVNIVYSLLSIPLALYYLGKEDFGLWILVVQLSGYLMLLDLGMIISVARFLADYKDNINGGDYGSVLKTGQAVLIIQAILVGFFGMLGLLVAPSLLHLPKEVTATFQILLGVQIFFVVLSFASRMVGSPLWCHQRYDITNLTASISLILNLFAMWIGFQCGMGVYSMLVGVAFSFVPSIGIPFWACRRLSFYPRRGCWGKFNYKLFKEIFYFGKDIFIISLGSQLTSASQVVLVSRVMGLEAASIWAVCTKSYIMGQQFISKIYDSAGGGLTELYVFGKKEIFTNRFQNIVSITAISAGFMAAAIFTFNKQQMFH